jgi:hypothetical protein
MIFVNDAHLADIAVTMFACDIFWISGAVGGDKKFPFPVNVNLRGAKNTKEFLKMLEKDFGSFSVFDMSERICK